jgi:hypothetical protein
LTRIAACRKLAPITNHKKLGRKELCRRRDRLGTSIPMSSQPQGSIMSRSSLREFVARALADNRILFGDLRRLQRDILPARITTREEAEILLFLDSVVERTDREWTMYLTRNVRDFVIWGLQPAGVVDRSKAEWIQAALSRADPTTTGRAIIHEIVREARRIDDDALFGLGAGRANRQCRSPQHRNPLSGLGRPRSRSTPAGYLLLTAPGRWCTLHASGDHLAGDHLEGARAQ